MNISDINTLSSAEVLQEIQLSKTEKRDTFFFKHKLASGQIRDVEVYSGPIKGDEGVLLYSIVFDITEKKQAQETIVYLKELYNNIINSVENFLFVKDTDGTYIACNNAFERLIGREKDEIIGKNDYDFFDKEAADSFRGYDKAILLENKPKSNFEWVTYSDGSKHYLLTVKAPLFDSNANVLGVVGNSVDVTERQHIEQELLISKDKFEKAFNKTPNMISLSNIDNGEIYDVNSTFEKLLGYKREEVIGKTAIELEMWADVNERKIFADKLRKDGFVEKMIINVNTRDKDVLIFELYANMVTIDDKKYVLAVANNITKQLKAERLLQESEERFKSLMEQSPFVIEIYDIDGLQTKVNHAYEVLWGFPAKHTLNKFNLFESEEVKQTGLIEYIKMAYSGKTVDVPIYKYNPVGKTEADGLGRVRWLKTIIYPLKDQNENIKNIVISHEDVTDKQETLELLEQKKKELETIIQEAPNPIMIHNEDGTVVLVNKVWQKLTGYSYSEIDTIEKWTKKAYGEEMPTAKKYIDELYELNHAVDEGESPIIRSDGAAIVWQFSSSPIGIIDGKRTVITSAMDITELKKKDEMLIAQSRLAAMGEMIGMIAHQWRQPIAGIAMDANNMLLDISLKEFDINNAEEYSNSILYQTEHLSKTIDDFRNFFKPDKLLATVKLKDIIEETHAIVKENLINNSIEFKSSYESNIEIESYPRELMQVFLNIINNAKDSLVANKIKDSLITVKVYDDDKYVNTDISDNGTGIDEEILPNIFDPYFTTKDEKTGTGLGLYMSKMIIEKHLNGKIEVSNKGKGICFSVRLPIIKSY